jgi:signal peptidase I
MDHNKKMAPWPFHFTWLLALTLLILLFLFVRFVLLDWHLLQGESMAPTLHSGQRVLIARWAYGIKNGPEEPYSLLWQEPSLGEIVIFRHQGQNYIKRIVGVPGDPLVCIDRWLKVGDSAYYLPEDSPFLQETPELIPPGFYFLVGDNRRFSEDSRRFGLVSIEKIQGRMLFYQQ